MKGENSAKRSKVIGVREIVSINYFDFDDAFIDTPERHSAWEMVFADRGSCHIVADGREFLLSQGQMYFHKPHEEHMLKLMRGEHCNVFIVTFESLSAAMGFFAGRMLTASMNTRQQIAAIIHEAGKTFRAIDTYSRTDSLSLIEEGGLFGGEQTVAIRLELMLIELIREHAQEGESWNGDAAQTATEDEFCTKIIDYMREHVNEKLSMDELSRAMSFSKSYISKRFAESCGCSVIDYFTLLKVEEAKRLIKSSNKNFFEIAETLMFSNSHYFSTVFKKYVGVTPTQYKKSIENE